MPAQEAIKNAMVKDGEDMVFGGHLNEDNAKGAIEIFRNEIENDKKVCNKTTLAGVKSDVHIEDLNCKIQTNHRSHKQNCNS